MEKKIECGGCAPPVYVDCSVCTDEGTCTCGAEPQRVAVDPAWEKAWDDKSPQRGS